MAILTGYFNSLNGDRKYNAETMSKYFSGLFSRGVLQNYANKFVVKATEGMKIQVPTGKAFFSDGKWIENTAPITLTLDNSDVVLNRIDRVVLRCDKNEGVRNASVVLKKGTPGTDPLPPELQNDDYIEELSLATIRINKLVESITQSSITNTIPDNAVCGYVTALIEQVDTSDLYLQYQTAYEEFRIESENTFDEWFNSIKDIVNVKKITEHKQYALSTENQTEIPITVTTFNPTLDILNVYVNGFKYEENKYTYTAEKVTLNSPLYAGNDIELVIYKMAQ